VLKMTSSPPGKAKFSIGLLKISSRTKNSLSPGKAKVHVLKISSAPEKALEETEPIFHVLKFFFPLGRLRN